MRFAPSGVDADELKIFNLAKGEDSNFSIFAALVDFFDDKTGQQRLGRAQRDAVHRDIHGILVGIGLD